MPESASQSSLDSKQYSKNGILQYERFFGYNWLSTGGEQTTKDLCLKLGLRPGQKVLDVGCGLGGGAVYMARQFGVKVHGIDLSTNMISIAQERLSRDEENIKNNVSFEVADALKIDLPENEFDVVYSRDTILHIYEKEKLFHKLYKWLKPGGTLLITDYMKGTGSLSQEYCDYVKQRGYFVTTVSEYEEKLKTCNFKSVEATDVSELFLDILKNELKYSVPTKEAFIKDFSEDDYDTMLCTWEAKIRRTEQGDQKWGLFKATK